METRGPCAASLAERGTLGPARQSPKTPPDLALVRFGYGAARVKSEKSIQLHTQIRAIS